LTRSKAGAASLRPPERGFARNVGGLNWGLVGLFQFDLVAAIFGGQDAALARIVHVLAGLSALWQLIRPARSFSTGEATGHRFQRD
jgi:uncharacterized membrane protein YuzA (DUF378 family)